MEIVSGWSQLGNVLTVSRNIARHVLRTIFRRFRDQLLWYQQYEHGFLEAAMLELYTNRGLREPKPELKRYSIRIVYSAEFSEFQNYNYILKM